MTVEDANTDSLLRSYPINGNIIDTLFCRILRCSCGIGRRIRGRIRYNLMILVF